MVNSVDELVQHERTSISRGIDEGEHDVLGTPKDLVVEAEGVVLVGRLGLCAALPEDAGHVVDGEERFAVGVFASGERQQFLCECVVLYPLFWLQRRIQS